jgi:outer membrane protein assembly factor BamB
VLWKADVGTGFSSFAVADGRVFTLGNTQDQDCVFALDASTGKTLWKFSYPEPLNPKMYEGGPNSTPTVDGARVYTASRTGKVFCFSASSGEVFWTNRLAEVVGLKNGDWGTAGSPLVQGQRLFVNYGSAMVALDKDSGVVLWQAAKESKGRYSFTTPMLFPDPSGGILLAHMQKALHALSPVDGRELWRHEFGRGFETHSSDPVLAPGAAFISSGDDGGELVAVTADKSARRWKNKNLGTFTGTAVLLDGHLFGVDAAGYKKGNQEFRCVNLETGEIRWRLPGFGQDSWIAAGDRIIVLTERGELIVMRARTDRAEELARAQVLGGKCWPQPVLANGVLYVRNAAGNVVCLDLRTHEPSR